MKGQVKVMSDDDLPFWTRSYLGCRVTGGNCLPLLYIPMNMMNAWKWHSYIYMNISL